MIDFISDEIRIKMGTRVDGSSEVVFVVGEYERNKIAELHTLIGKNVKVSVEEEK